MIWSSGINIVIIIILRNGLEVLSNFTYKMCTHKCNGQMNFGIEPKFSSFENLWCFYLEESKFDLILISCGHQPHNLSLTFSSFLNVASISFSKLFFLKLNI